MNLFRHSTLAVLVSLVTFAGCAATQEKILPVHDDVLVYDLPFDLTYLRTLEALENVKDWELESTEKEKGLIGVRNVAFGRFDDADERKAMILVKRVSRGQTSVQLALWSQRVIGGDKLLERIAQYVSQEL